MSTADGAARSKSVLWPETFREAFVSPLGLAGVIMGHDPTEQSQRIEMLCPSRCSLAARESNPGHGERHSRAHIVPGRTLIMVAVLLLRRHSVAFARLTAGLNPDKPWITRNRSR